MLRLKSRISIILAFSIFLFGVVTYDMENYRWGVFSLVLYSIPLFSFIFKNTLLRAYSIWFGLFLVTQTFLSYFVYLNYYHLPQNMHHRIDVQGDGLPGIQGLQIISTDALGFRTTKNIDYHKRPEGIRIFALGASTTESIYLDDHKTWPHLLQEKLAERSGKPVEVINAGLSGLRMVHIYDNFKYILKFHPDIVLFLVGVNDWNQDILNHFEPEVEKLNRFYSTFGLEYHEITKIYLRNTLLGRLIKNYRYSLLGLLTHPFKKEPFVEKSVEGIKPEKGEYYTKQNNTLTKQDVRVYAPTNILLEYRTYLEKTADLCKKRHLECFFLTEPNAYKKNVDKETQRHFWMTPPNASYTLDLNSMVAIASTYNSKLVDFAHQHSIPVCDLDNEVPSSIKSFYDEVHFNENGSLTVANFLTDCILNRINSSR